METLGGKSNLAPFHFPTMFCKPKLTKLRLRDDHLRDGDGEWEELEHEWMVFWQAKGGKEGLDNKCRGFVNGVYSFWY